MQRILITGSNGLLGQKLVHLLRQKKDVLLLATSTGPNRVNETQGYEYASLDITDKDAVNHIIDRFKPTAVINTAAMTLVDLCETEIEKCDRLNVQAVGYLLHACMRNDAHLVQVSTDFVFNGEEGPYRETDIPDPLSEYSRSKYKAECLLTESTYTNWAIARTIILYGIGDNMSRSNVVLWARQALKEGKEMKIVHDQYRSPTLSEDLAEGCWQIVDRKAHGIYHLSGPETMSVIEMVRRIAAYDNLDDSKVVPVDTASLAQPAKRPPRTGFVIDKARRDLEYDPRTIEEGLAIMDKQ